MSPAAPAAIESPIRARLVDLHARYAGLLDGEVATYIPELGRANPEWFGICLATVDGHVYEVGDTAQPFTIQSISKAFVYGLAMEDQGREAVLRKIGVEPTGDAFNAVSLEPGTGRPLNPMINAGAIAATSLIAGRSDQDRLARLLGVLSLYAGRGLEVDQAVFESEHATGHRNRAIGHMLRNFEIVSDDPDPPLDLYFRQCSVTVTCRDLALMAATLANGGVQPITGDRALREDLVPSVLSVMTTCGMYDFAGEWVYWVGAPAKSGVSGGVLAVLPGQLGIGVFSPRLDAHGNSVRGVAVCKELSRDFGLHFLRVARSSRSAVRRQYSLATVRSKRRRPESEQTALDATGDATKVYELQGDLGFATVEVVVRRVVADSGRTEVALLDVERVARIDGAAGRMLLDLCVSAWSRDKLVVFVGAQRHPTVLRAVEEALTRQGAPPGGFNFVELDAALEWCEKRILQRHPGCAPAAPRVTLADQEVCRGLDAAALAALEPLLDRRRFSAGEFIMRTGESADGMYLLVEGQVSVVMTLANGQLRRLATLTPGMAFGELAMVTRAHRSADLRADQPVDCFVLSTDAFDRLGREHPAVKVTLLENMLCKAHETVAYLNRQVTALER